MQDNQGIRSSDAALARVARKVLAGERLDRDDGLVLLATPDLHTLGRLAHHVRTARHGNRVYYNRNRHINYTNVCALSCKFCAFHRKRGDDGAYEMTVPQIVDVARQAHGHGATEVHIVGGLHPWLKFDYYLDMLSKVRAACPGLHVKAFTAIEIVHFSRISRLPVEGVLEQLQAAGLGSLPGGGAEIFDDRVHKEAFPLKAGAGEWFRVHRAAHAMGIASNATMLYGHVEKPVERLDHLLALRKHQDESLAAGGASFNCLVPLPFVPAGSELAHLPGPAGIEQLRTLAIARLVLDNVPHLKAFWVMMGLPLAQVALSYGCDDLDGTVVWYDITRTQGEGTHQEMTLGDLCRLAVEAGFEPTERDTLYRPIAP